MIPMTTLGSSSFFLRTVFKAVSGNKFPLGMDLWLSEWQSLGEWFQLLKFTPRTMFQERRGDWRERGGSGHCEVPVICLRHFRCTATLILIHTEAFI